MNKMDDMKKPRTTISMLALMVAILMMSEDGLTQVYGLEWPGDGSVRRMLYWHNPFPIYDATYIFKVYPRKKTGDGYNYYTTFFWGNDGLNSWDGGFPNTYYGAHPYPIPAPTGPGQWEIAVYSNDFVTWQEVDWNRWYTQVFRAWRESSSITHHEFYWDWPDTSKVITVTVNDPAWANKNPPTPAIVMGQAPDWNGVSWGGYPGWEEFNGVLRGIQIYSGLLSLTDIQSEIATPKSSVNGQNRIWYLNLNPRPSDVTDKKGTGTRHDGSWDGTTALEWSDQIAPDITPPSAPSNLTAQAVGGAQVNLSWTASTDNVGVSDYRVERCASAGCTGFSEIGTSLTNAYSDTTVLVDTSYTYRVRARDNADNPSGYSNTATTITDASSPTDPSNLTATPTSGTQITLLWTGSTDNLAVTGYRLERCQGVGCSAFVQIASPSGTSYINTGLTSGASYSYRVRATDAAGNLSGYSNIASAAPLDTVAPSAPSGLAATAVSSSQINLSWTASTDNVGVTRYRLERCQAQGNCTNFSQIATPTGTSYSDTNVVAGTKYYYRARAEDAAGNLGGYSNTDSATTKRR